MSGTVGQQAGFRLLRTAADASLARWVRDPSEHRADVELSDDQHAELEGALKVAHQVAEQIYFASGAFSEKQRQADRPENLEVFADLAFPVIAACAALRVPQCIHLAIETMVYLAPLDEARALRSIAEAIPADGRYARESMAGTEIIPYLERLLAEQRQLVLYDEHGVVAFRHLLATFAGEGNQAALALAYTFADVFR
jgi:hypothetical protein